MVAGGGEGLDEQQVCGLPQRRLGDRLLREGHRLGLVAGRRRGPGRRLQRLLMRPRQAVAAAPRPLGVGVVGQRLAAPVRQGRPQLAQRHRRLPAGQPLAPGLQPGEEQLAVHHAAVAAGEQVTAGDGLDR